jgi:uncharacterized protein (DUF1697 family)
VPRFVALLRGVNVGGKNPLAMVELRALVESLGFADVRTFIQSGNVVFSSDEPVVALDLERPIEARFGLAVAVVLRTAAELERVVQADPFPEAERARVHVGFMAGRPRAAAAAALDHARFLPEEFVVSGRELYLHLPSGMARTTLPAYLGRALDVPTTLRNWNTVTKLLELARG